MVKMIEVIIESDILQKKDGTKTTPEDVWNYSSSGELYMIFEWYRLACEVLKEKGLDNEKNIDYII